MDDWSALLAHLGGTGRVLAPGEALFRDGDEIRALYRVERGRVRLSRAGAALHTARPGSFLAEDDLFATHHRGDALAEEPSRVVAYPKAALLLYLRAHPDLILGLAAHLAREVRRLRGQREILRLAGARERVLAWLGQLGAADRPVTPDGSLMAAAAEIGLTHEAFYRTLAALERDGRLERPGKRTFRLR
jgi:CRP-like cAMP-binding protein